MNEWGLNTSWSSESQVEKAEIKLILPLWASLDKEYWERGSNS